MLSCLLYLDKIHRCMWSAVCLYSKNARSITCLNIFFAPPLKIKNLASMWWKPWYSKTDNTVIFWLCFSHCAWRYGILSPCAEAHAPPFHHGNQQCSGSFYFGNLCRHISALWRELIGPWNLASMWWSPCTCFPPWKPAVGTFILESFSAIFSYIFTVLSELRPLS